jgi:uncharacterized protein
VRLFRLGVAAGVALIAAPPAELIKELGVRIRMRDGVHLAANIFRHAEPARLPTILVRTPYNKGADLTPYFKGLVDRGYALAIEDVRGRYESEGSFEPLTQEPQDGDDTLNWIAAQPWSDGKIAMMGGSYLGIVQWKAALTGNPHLKAIFPVVSGDDDYRDRFYSEGGAMKIGSRVLWASQNLRVSGYIPPDFTKYVRLLPLRRTDHAATGRATSYLQNALNHPSYDDFWQSTSTRTHLSKVRVPVFSVGGWYDNFVQGDLDAFATLQPTCGTCRILIGPWAHNILFKFANTDFGPEANVSIRALQVAWFDHWLKGRASPVLSRPPVRIFVMGANRWREEERWPPPGVQTRIFFLHGRGRADASAGKGRLAVTPPRRDPPDGFVFDPRNPAPTLGGAVCCDPKMFPWGPLDQRPVEQRPDVLTYTSEVLTHDLEVIGPVKVVLYAATSARDTDFTAKLVDVFPSGYARNLTDGILRLRYRNSLEKPKLAVPGEIYRLTIDAGVTSNVFLKGHRIRLEISSSNFPRFDRNPNTGRVIADETEMRKASQTVYHDRARPSQLLLPVLPSVSVRASRHTGARSAAARITSAAFRGRTR